MDPKQSSYANTERYTQVDGSLHGTAGNFVSAIKRDEAVVAQSTLYTVTSIVEGCAYSMLQKF